MKQYKATPEAFKGNNDVLDSLIGDAKTWSEVGEAHKHYEYKYATLVLDEETDELVVAKNDKDEVIYGSYFTTKATATTATVDADNDGEEDDVVDLIPVYNQIQKTEKVADDLATEEDEAKTIYYYYYNTVVDDETVENIVKLDKAGETAITIGEGEDAKTYELIAVKNDEGVQIGVQILVGFVDTGKAFNRGTVNADLVVQCAFYLRSGNRTIIHGTENIGKLHTDEVDAVFFHHADNVFFGIFAHKVVLLSRKKGTSKLPIPKHLSALLNYSGRGGLCQGRACQEKAESRKIFVFLIPLSGKGENLFPKYRGIKADYPLKDS